MKKIFYFVLLLFTLNFSLFLQAQDSSESNSNEYIVSSSPLPGGGRVISRSSADTGIQTVTTVTEVTTVRANPRAASTGPAFSSSSPNAVGVYPYPANTVGQKPFIDQAIPANSAVTYPPFRATANVFNQPVNYQVPTLGITTTPPAARISQSTRLPGAAGPRRIKSTSARIPPACGCYSQTNLQVTGYEVPVTDPFAISPPSGLTVQRPAVSGQFNSANLTAQPIGRSQSAIAGRPQFQSVPSQGWEPVVSGSGAYQPIIQLANMKPGTYLGRGIIGQPKAYVDGQPVRNLLRYVFP